MTVFRVSRVLGWYLRNSARS